MWIAWLEIERPAARPAELAAPFDAVGGPRDPAGVWTPMASGRAEAMGAALSPDRARNRVFVL